MRASRFVAFVGLWVFALALPALSGAQGTNCTGQPPQECGSFTETFVVSTRPVHGPGQATGGGALDTFVPGRPEATFGFSVFSDADLNLNGRCMVREQAVTVTCVDVTQYTQEGNHATFSGTAEVNGVETTYHIDVQDNTQSNAGNDTFTIVTGEGYSRFGVVTRGDIQVNPPRESGPPATGVPLQGEHFEQFGNIVHAECFSSADTHTIAYTASGAALGPYPGEFHETGMVVVSVDGDVLSFDATFQVDSGDTQISGEKHLAEGKTATATCSSRFGRDFGDAEATLAFSATISGPDGTFGDQGYADVAVHNLCDPNFEICL
jgi:hypothetical protein